jgi:hypothetical protein
MAHWLFPDFLKDSSAYANAQHHWEALWQKVLGTTELAAAWQSPWMNNPFPDGNPIFSAVCSTLHRGVRIIQEEPGEPGDTDLDWWLDHFGEKDEPDTIHELVIACCPSRENAAQIEQLLRRWVASGDLNLRQPVGEAEIN